MASRYVLYSATDPVRTAVDTAHGITPGTAQEFGCLFGVRNRPGWEPVAERRGLPSGASDEVREEYDRDAALDGAIGAATWISWPELRDLDMTVTPQARGILETTEDGSGATTYQRIDGDWPPTYGTWRNGATTVTFTQVTRHDILGPGTGWHHVTAVLTALAARFGDDNVRLVVWFD